MYICNIFVQFRSGNLLHVFFQLSPLYIHFTALNLLSISNAIWLLISHIVHIPLNLFVTTRKRSLGQSNVFTHVCHSVCFPVCITGHMTGGGGSPSRGRGSAFRWWGSISRGVCIRPTGTGKEDITHPSGMLSSCSFLSFSIIPRFRFLFHCFYTSICKVLCETFMLCRFSVTKTSNVDRSFFWILIDDRPYAHYQL